MTQQQKPFELEQLEEQLEVHGCRLERWPEELQPLARRLLESSPEARATWASAERLAALLDAAPDVLPSAALQARVAALPARHPQGWAAWWPFGNPFAPLLAWGAAAAIGLVVGSGAVPGFDLDASDDSAVASFTAEPEEADADTATPDEWTDLELELALGLDPEWEEEP